MKDTGSDMTSIIPIKNIAQVREDEQGNLLLLCCGTITELIISGDFPLRSITVLDLNYGVPRPTIVVAASCLVTLAQRDLTAMTQVFSVSPHTEGPWDKAAIFDSTGVAVRSVQLPSANLLFQTYQKHPTINMAERLEVADAILRALLYEDWQEPKPKKKVIGERCILAVASLSLFDLLDVIYENVGEFLSKESKDIVIFRVNPSMPLDAERCEAERKEQGRQKVIILVDPSTRFLPRLVLAPSLVLVATESRVYRFDPALSNMAYRRQKLTDEHISALIHMGETSAPGVEAWAIQLTNAVPTVDSEPLDTAWGEYMPETLLQLHEMFETRLGNGGLRPCLAPNVLRWREFQRRLTVQGFLRKKRMPGFAWDPKFEWETRPDLSIEPSLLRSWTDIGIAFLLSRVSPQASPKFNFVMVAFASLAALSDDRLIRLKDECKEVRRLGTLTDFFAKDMFRTMSKKGLNWFSLALFAHCDGGRDMNAPLFKHSAIRVNKASALQLRLTREAMQESLIALHGTDHDSLFARDSVRCTYEEILDIEMHLVLAWMHNLIRIDWNEEDDTPQFQSVVSSEYLTPPRSHCIDREMIRYYGVRGALWAICTGFERTGSSVVPLGLTIFEKVALDNALLLVWGQKKAHEEYVEGLFTPYQERVD